MNELYAPHHVLSRRLMPPGNPPFGPGLVATGGDDPGDRDQFERRFLRCLWDQCPDIALAMVDPYNPRFASIADVGVVIDAMTRERVEVAWRDPTVYLPRRAAALQLLLQMNAASIHPDLPPRPIGGAGVETRLVDWRRT